MTYYWKTDAASGYGEDIDLTAALTAVCDSENINADTIADGAWAWVEDVDTGDRRGTPTFTEPT